MDHALFRSIEEFPLHLQWHTAFQLNKTSIHCPFTASSCTLFLCLSSATLAGLLAVSLGCQLLSCPRTFAFAFPCAWNLLALSRAAFSLYVSVQMSPSDDASFPGLKSFPRRGELASWVFSPPIDVFPPLFSLAASSHIV